MSDWLKNIIEKVKDLSSSIDKYREETVIQSLPSYTFVNRAKALIEKGQYKQAEEVLHKALELPQGKEGFVLAAEMLGTFIFALGVAAATRPLTAYPSVSFSRSDPQATVPLFRGSFSAFQRTVQRPSCRCR